MYKLKYLAKNSLSFSIEVDEHKTVYDTVEAFVNDEKDNIEPEVLKKMIDTNTTVRVYLYPTTTIGFYIIFHYDVNKAIDQAIKLLNNK